MRVLVVHNNYSSRVPSGENLAVRDEVAWLRAVGVEVDLLAATNDDVVDGGLADRAKGALWSAWSRPAQRRFDEAADRFRPDLVHVHNPFPLLTGSVLATASRRGLPIVWTVHNRRVVCVGGGYFRDDAPCTQCRPGWRLPGIRHGCYNRSSAASGLVTVSSSIYRALARRRVTAVAPSAYVRDWLVDTAGFDPARVRLKYNGVDRPAPGTVLKPAAESRSFVFVGRLAAYKGVSVLLDAWERTRGTLDAELRIVGDGTLADEVRRAAAADPRITWLGALEPEEIPGELAVARAVVMPSTVKETFGRVAAEAMAHERAVIATAQGGLAEILDDTCGWVVEPDAAALAATLVEVASGDAGADAEVAERARRGRERYESRFSPEATTAALIDVYDQAVSGTAPARRATG
jgi:glycosyltransferase involved in cell wall biosynthesis